MLFVLPIASFGMSKRASCSVTIYRAIEPSAMMIRVSSDISGSVKVGKDGCCGSYVAVGMVIGTGLEAKVGVGAAAVDVGCGI